MAKKCPHGKQKSFCKDCGGSQICEHNKHKSQCKDCGGSGICEHNKVLNKEWNTRIQLLTQSISKYLHTIPEKEINVEYLFYDS